VLVDGLGVCASYAYAFNAHANAAGVETTVVLGNVLAGGRHSWNKVKIDGKWLAVDPTWNDTLATDDYVMVPDTAFTGIAKRVEDKMWMSDQYLAGFATR
jgi:transglutaminase-like putative cysteine protease